MHIFFSDQMLSIAIGTAVLFPFVALAFASVHINYATRDGIRKTLQRATHKDMQIRTITRKNVPDLLEILRTAGPHGHREWPTSDAVSLLATLDNPRLDPDLGRWAMAFRDGAAVGYSLVEPELNIGRVLVGLASVDKHSDAFEGLLADGIERATELADLDRFEIHVAVRENESPIISDILKSTGFEVVRTALKMRVDVGMLALRRSTVPRGSTLREAEMLDGAEATAVTNLHNACFVDSWGFSPNTVDEIVGRAAIDAERNGFTPILVVENRKTGALDAYIWITLKDGDGRIEMVGVSPDLRGTGLGWTIFNAGVEQLIANGATELSLDVDSQNPPARRIYESVGYRTYAQVPYFGLEIVKD